MNHICQSEKWVEFKQSYGTKSVKVGGISFFLTKVPLINKYVGYCPKVNLTKVDWEAFKKAGKREGCIFIKFDPNNIGPVGLIKHIRKGESIFAQETILFDLTPSEEALLSDMRSKTRYNIRLAERKGVTVREGKTLKDLEVFLKLQKETAKRQGFLVHPDEYYRKMWEVLYPVGMLKLLIAEIDSSKAVASWLLFAHQKTLYYPYGGSDYKYRDLMASSLLMWEAIKLGKKLGCTSFDMWGATSDRRDPYWGFTKFKLGFGGKIVQFANSVDLVINKPLYWVFQIADIIRWAILKVTNSLRSCN